MSLIRNAFALCVLTFAVWFAMPINEVEAQPRPGQTQAVGRRRRSRFPRVRRPRVRQQVARRPPPPPMILRPAAGRPRTPLPANYLEALRGPGYATRASAGRTFLPRVRTAYNRMVRVRWAWWGHIQRCAAMHAEFVEVANFYRVPVAFVAGLALHESHCNTRARDWAGGQGPMQITFPANVAGLERLLGRRLDWRHIVLDNLYMGVEMWAQSERRVAASPIGFLSTRAFGVLGYNMNLGTFGPRYTTFRARRPRPAPTFARFARRPNLPCIRGNHGRCPQRYVDEVFAAALMYYRYSQHLPLVAVGSLTERDVPGFDPALDRSFSDALVHRTLPFVEPSPRRHRRR